MIDEERFTGTEKSPFTEDARQGIRELINVLTEAEEDVIRPKDTASVRNTYIALRSSFRKVHLLVSEKIADVSLNEAIERWIWTENVVESSEKRTKAVKEAGVLVTKLIKELSASGLIDLKGSSFAGSYPFKDLVIKQVQKKDIDIEELSDYDVELLNELKEHEGIV